VIQVDQIWMATEPLDMRAGPDTALARVVQVFGEAKPHSAYLFANKRGNRMKVLVHDGFGLWLAARRLHQGSFVWGKSWQGERVALNAEQLQALVIGLPWQQVGRDNRIAVI
jgi:transposase